MAKSTCQLRVGEVHVFSIAMGEKDDACWLGTWTPPTGGMKNFFAHFEVVVLPLTEIRCWYSLGGDCQKANDND